MNNPEFSILVLNYNGLRFLDSCLNSIAKYIDHDVTELIIIDNGSADGSVEFIKNFSLTQQNIKTILLDQNYGAPIARNKGLKIARGKKILLLDNDVTWHGDVLSELNQHFQDAVGIVGMCAVFMRSLSDYYHLHQNLVNQPMSANASTGYCLLMSAELIQKGVLFDENLKITQGDDIDLCIQTFTKGYKVIAAPNIPLIHYEHGSLETYQNQYQEIMKNNHQYLINKWQKLDPSFFSNHEKITTVAGEDKIIKLSLKLDKLHFYDIVLK